MLAVDGPGNVYLTDALPTKTCINKYTSDGIFITYLCPMTPYVHYSGLYIGAAFDTSGNMYVADGSYEVLKFALYIRSWRLPIRLRM